MLQITYYYHYYYYYYYYYYYIIFLEELIRSISVQIFPTSNLSDAATKYRVIAKFITVTLQTIFLYIICRYDYFLSLLFNDNEGV
jgi:hypothetical protein